MSATDQTARAERPALPLDAVAVRPAPTLALVWALAALAMASAPVSMAATWIASSTYHHAALAVPAALYLLWRARATLRPAETSLVGAAAVGFFAALWLVAQAARVNVAEQLAFVSVLIALFATVYGLANARRAALGLGFLYFAVPFGESLRPLLQQSAAQVVAGALSLVGVPTARDATLITTSAGRFVIADACAGLNFLLAAAFVATLFSAIAFRRWRRRAAFIALALVLAVAANLLRAFLVIYLATTTPLGMAFAADHAWFGWTLYAAFLFVLMLIGRTWRDAPPPPAGPSPGFAARRPYPIALAAVVVVAAAGYGALIVSRPAPQSVATVSPGSDWRPLGDGVFTDGLSTISVLTIRPGGGLEPPGAVEATFGEDYRVVARDRIAGTSVVRTRLAGPEGRTQSATLATLVGDSLYLSRRDAALAAARARLAGAAPALAAVVVSSATADDATLARFVGDLSVDGR